MPGGWSAVMLFRWITTGIFRFAAWLFGPRAAWLDLKLAVLAGAWSALMVGKPAMFDRGSFVGLSWLPDTAWICIMSALAVVHVLGLLRPRLHKVRIAASLASAWIWIFVAASLARVEISTGFFNYAIVGFGAVLGAIYVAGLPRERA